MTKKKLAFTAGGDTRPAGLKGIQTRAQIIETTKALLEDTRLRDLTVAQISRVTDMSTSSFYTYFKDVTDVVLAGVEDISQSTPLIMSLLDGDWSQNNARDQALKLVESYVSFWQENRTLFRIRNLSAEEGDIRFVHVRQRSVQPILERVQVMVVDRQAAGKIPGDLNAYAVASSLIAMLERIASVAGTVFADGSIRPVDITFPRIQFEEILQSTAYCLTTTLTK